MHSSSTVTLSGYVANLARKTKSASSSRITLAIPTMEVVGRGFTSTTRGRSPTTRSIPA